MLIALAVAGLAAIVFLAAQACGPHPDGAAAAAAPPDVGGLGRGGVRADDRAGVPADDRADRCRECVSAARVRARFDWRGTIMARQKVMTAGLAVLCLTPGTAPIWLLVVLMMP